MVEMEYLKVKNMTQKQLFQQPRWDNPVEKLAPHLCPECVGAGKFACGLDQETLQADINKACSKTF